jgi:peptidoglycan endopeptidase LytE
MTVIRRLAVVVTLGIGVGALTMPAITHAENEQTYVVAEGDTLIGIASKSGIRLSDLLRSNNLRLTSRILPGQELDISSSAGETASSASTPTSSPAVRVGETYGVRWGDTLIGIARRHRVSLASLVEVNQMTTTSLIMPGMQLSLPSGATDKSGVSPAAPTSQQTITSSGSGATAVVNYALAQVGKPYRFFTKGPDAFDCSGLSLAAYQQIGVKLVHYSAWQARQGTSVDFRNQPIQPGDLIFQANRGSDTINHVGIAVTSTTWIHAVGTGIPVRVGPMPAMSTIAVVRRYVDSV